MTDSLSLPRNHWAEIHMIAILFIPYLTAQEGTLRKNKGKKEQNRETTHWVKIKVEVQRSQEGVRSKESRPKLPRLACLHLWFWPWISELTGCRLSAQPPQPPTPQTLRITENPVPAMDRLRFINRLWTGSTTPQACPSSIKCSSWKNIQYQSKVWTHLHIQGFFFIFTIFNIVE